MIRSLHLEKYGKFAGETLDFGPFSVVYGPNEAGKTTIFDALFEAVCAGAPKKGQVWTRLAARYGEERRFKASGTVPQFRNGVEFLELYAIRAGEISLNAEGKESWAEAARRTLFRHGLNPADVAEKLEKRASSNNSLLHQKRLNALNADLARVRSEIETFRTQEAEAAGAKEGLARLDGEIAELERQAGGLAAEAEAAAGRLEGFKKERALKQALRDRDFIAGVIEAETRRAGLAAFDPDKVREYDELLSKAAGFEREEAEASGGCAAALEAVQRIEEESCSLLESRQLAKRISEEGQKLLPQVEKIAMLRYGQFAVLHLPAWLRYAGWGAAAACALLSLLFGRGHAGGYIAAALFAAAGFVLDWQMFRPKTSENDLAAERRRLEQIYARWTELGFSRADIERGSAAEVAEVLAGFKSIALSWDIAVENNKRESEAAKASVKDFETRRAEMAAAKEAAAKEADDWLAAAGASSRDEYIVKAGSQASLDAEAQKNEARVKELAGLEGCSSAGALLALLDGRVKELERAGVRERADFERDIEAAEEQVRQAAEARAGAEAKLNELKVKREGLAALFGRDMSRVPAELHSLRLRAAELEAEAGEEMLARSGAALAAEIFREIENDSGRKFAGLAGEVRPMLARLLPEADLLITSLGLDGVSVKDAAGSARPLGALSSGTADCFMLAARLTLAAADRGKEPGLLLLDDPFASLDAARRSAALGLLKEFQAHTGWQVLLFTKDRALLAAVEKDPQVTPLTLA